MTKYLESFITIRKRQNDERVTRIKDPTKNQLSS